MVVMPVLLRLAFGLPLSALAGWGAWRLAWLDAAGACSAAAVGLAVFVGAGWPGAGALLAFFVTSTLLGRLPGRPGGRGHAARTARQVLANGGVAALAALFHGAAGGARALAALFGALAAANSDTWATEFGIRARAIPRRLWIGRPVSAGTSGGTTLRGVAGAAAGAALLGVCGLAAGVRWWAAALAGLTGSTADTLAGGTIQVAYRCPQCGRTVEQPAHDCPGRAVRARGLPGLDNDAVNLMATIVGAAVAALLAHP